MSILFVVLLAILAFVEGLQYFVSFCRLTMSDFDTKREFWFSLIPMVPVVIFVYAGAKDIVNHYRNEWKRLK